MGLAQYLAVMWEATIFWWWNGVRLSQQLLRVPSSAIWKSENNKIKQKNTQFNTVKTNYTYIKNIVCLKAGTKSKVLEMYRIDLATSLELIALILPQKLCCKVEFARNFCARKCQNSMFLKSKKNLLLQFCENKNKCLVNAHKYIYEIKNISPQLYY